jgi:hypothetical protein
VLRGILNTKQQQGASEFGMVVGGGVRVLCCRWGRSGDAGLPRRHWSGARSRGRRATPCAPPQAPSTSGRPSLPSPAFPAESGSGGGGG